MKRIKKIYHRVDKRTLVAFLTVGLLSAVIYYGLFSFFYGLLKVHYKWSLTLAYLLSSIFNFLSNREMTFKSKTHAAHVQLIKYFSLSFMNYLLNLGLVHFAVAELMLSPYIAVILAIGCCVPFTYTMSRYWVFRK